jgi:hypothetical protein
VVQVLVDFASLSVLAKETTEDTHAAHPKDLTGHTGISSTLTLTVTHVATSTLSSSMLANTETGVGNLGLADDQTILDKLANVLTYSIEYQDVNFKLWLIK